MKIDLQKIKSIDGQALEEAERLKDVLNRVYPDEGDNSSILCGLLQKGFVAQLKSILASNSGRLPQSELGQLSAAIHEQSGFDSSQIAEALSCWAQVLSATGVAFGAKVDLSQIKVHDASLLTDAQRLSEALGNIFPEDTRGRTVACLLLRVGIVEQIKLLAADNHNQVTVGALEELGQQAEDQFGMSPKIAVQGLENWCRALDIEVKGSEACSSAPVNGSGPEIRSDSSSKVETCSSGKPACSSSLSGSTGSSAEAGAGASSVAEGGPSLATEASSTKAEVCPAEVCTDGVCSSGACPSGASDSSDSSSQIGGQSSDSKLAATSAPGATISLSLPNNVSLELIWCQPGTFTMGSPASELGRYDDEEPQHQVTLTEGFYLSKYPVTQEQYQAATGSNPSEFSDSDAKRPLERVSWSGALGFCERVNCLCGRQLLGYKFGLPSEAQWEYACRAGTATALSSGQNLTSNCGTCNNLNKVAWYGQNSGAVLMLFGGKTFPVGQKQANGWGFFDMYGNVWEWCRDWYGAYSGQAAIDPQGPARGTLRVVRGGSWNNAAGSCRSACRGYVNPGSRRDDLGFRLAAWLIK